MAGAVTAVIVGSVNDAKRAAAEAVAAALLPGCAVRYIGVESSVAEQPVGLAAVRRGARHRAILASRTLAGALGAGMESGLRYRGAQLWVIGTCVLAVGGGVIAEAETAAYPLPKFLARSLRDGLDQGLTLAHATAAQWGGTQDHWARRGTVDALTRGAVSRQDLWRQALALALGAALADGRLAGGCT